MTRPLKPQAVEAWEIQTGRADSYYVKVLTRILAAHAMTQKLCAVGYWKMRDMIADPILHALAEQSYAREHRHARSVYGILDEIGVSERAAERTLISARRSPSFEAVRFFSDQAQGELDLVMAGLSLETSALLILGINYAESSYAPHARLAQDMLEEKAASDQVFADLFTQAVDCFGPQAVNQKLMRWLPMAANSFGPAGSGFTNECLRLGLKRKDNQELADFYLSMVARRCGSAGLNMPRLTSSYPRQLA